MITLTIDRTSLGLLPLTITDDGTGIYSLMPGFDLGAVTADNVYAESRWQDGAVLTSSRRPMTSIAGVIRVNTTTLSGLVTQTAALAEALSQFTYTVTVNAGTPVSYSCCPATWRRMFDPNLMRAGRDLIVVSIPRQP